MLVDENLRLDTPFVSFAEATHYLEQMCKEYRVRHLSYWSLEMADGLPDQVSWIATYDPAYMSHYMARFTPLGDPAFEPGERRLIDWDDLNATADVAEEIQREAEHFGIGRHGLSYQFNDGLSRTIMFSANVGCKADEWPAERQRVSLGLPAFARHFHERVKAMVDARRISDAA